MAKDIRCYDRALSRLSRIVDRVSVPGGAGHTAGALVVEAGRKGATHD